MNNIEQNKTIAQDWLAAFNDHDLDKLLRLYCADAMHYSPKLRTLQPHTQGIIKGEDALREWWRSAFERMPSLQYRSINLIVDDFRVLMEYRRTVEGENDMMVAEILEIEHGLIIRSRVYHG